MDTTSILAIAAVVVIAIAIAAIVVFAPRLGVRHDRDDIERHERESTRHLGGEEPGGFD